MNSIYAMNGIITKKVAVLCAVFVAGLLVGVGMGRTDTHSGEGEFSDAASVGATTRAEPEERASTTERAGGSAAIGGEEEGTVVRVVDGDTIDVQIGGVVERVRYVGIDTPETVHPNKPLECYGKEASAKNTELVMGREVRLVRDVSERDTYDRLLRYVYVGEVFVNEALVRGGYAHAYTYPPDVAHDALFVEAEREAREREAGLWSSACAEVPENPAAADTPQSASAGTGCSIKGNINAEGEKIFHVLGCGSYAKTVVKESDGERWFCTEAEAVAAGWRKAQNCS
jgi:micrococcal nuclease